MGCFRSRVLEDEYTIQDSISAGEFSSVYKAICDADGEEVAIKIIEKNLIDNRTIENEIAILKEVDHPNIIKYIDDFKSVQTVEVVLELMNGGELFDRIISTDGRCYTEVQACEAMKQITSAVEYIHKRKIVHRDIKPENLMYENNSPDSLLKLADFGLATKIGENGLHDQKTCGTPTYVAPEILKEEAYGFPVDIWSLGVVIYIVLCGFPPFVSTDVKELYEEIKEGKFDFPEPFWTDISKSAKDLVSKCLIIDPSKRITAAEILMHEWIKNPGKGQMSKDYHEQLSKFNKNTKKLNKCIHTIILANRMKKVMTTNKEKSRKEVIDELRQSEIGLKIPQKELGRRNSVMPSTSVRKSRILPASSSMMSEIRSDLEGHSDF